MPIKTQGDLPAKEILENENIDGVNICCLVVKI